MATGEYFTVMKLGTVRRLAGTLCMVSAETGALWFGNI